MPKFKIYHSNGQTKVITAKNLDEAEKKANKIWKGWTDIYILEFAPSRKLSTFNKAIK